MRWRMGWIAALLMAMPGARAAAQERVDQLDLPRSVADKVIDFFNEESTIRFTGRVDIPAGRVIMGDVAVLGGPVTVAGEIRGDLVVVNGSLTVEDSGSVSGDVTVLGGVAHVQVEQVGGQLAVYDEDLPYRHAGDRIRYDEHRWSRWTGGRDRSHISVRVEQNYNRVEGLPVMFGPVFQTSGPDMFRLDVLAIWRSESGPHLSSDELGWFLRAEQHFGPGGRFSVGGSAHSMVQPIESWKLTNVEASLAAFLLHEDYRDYYKREGFSAYARYDDPATGVRLTGEYRNEDNGFLAAVSPWTLRRNADPWRSQPLVGEGRISTMTGELVVDDRNDPEDPSDGWYLNATATHAAGFEGGMAVLVIGSALLLVAQGFVGFLGFLELFFRFRVVRVAIGMVLHRQPAISLLDFFIGSVAVDAQYFVVVAFAHGQRTKDRKPGCLMMAGPIFDPRSALLICCLLLR